MRFTTRTRLNLILAELTPITGTAYTVAPTTPKARQNFEGYVVWSRMARNRPITLNADQVQNNTAWVITLLSPDVLLGLSYDVEGYMYQYMDAITALLQRRRQLQTSAGVLLDDVFGITLGDETFTSPSPYPDQQQEKQFFRWTMNLDIQLLSSRNC
jgi:hypothetical protein